MPKLPLNKNDLVYQWMSDVQDKTHIKTPEKFENEIEIGDVYDPSVVPGKRKEYDLNEALPSAWLRKQPLSNYPWINVGNLYFNYDRQRDTTNYIKTIPVETEPPEKIKERIPNWQPSVAIQESYAEPKTFKWMINLQVGPLSFLNETDESRNSSWWGIDLEVGNIDEGMPGIAGFHVEKDYQTEEEAFEAARELMAEMDKMTIEDLIDKMRETVTYPESERIVG